MRNKDREFVEAKNAVQTKRTNRKNMETLKIRNKNHGNAIKHKTTKNATKLTNITLQ